MKASTAIHTRILLITGDAGVSGTFRANFGVPAAATEPADSRGTSFDLSVAVGSDEGIEMARLGAGAGHPYEVAFVDVGTRSGIDGMRAIEGLWGVDPELEVVACASDGDCSWERVMERVDRPHQLLLMRTPVDRTKAHQVALVQARKRRAEASARQCDELRALNRRLHEELAARARAEHQLKYDALHDGLTSMPNRLLLADRLQRCIERSKRNAEYLYAVLFIDLDGFKQINDTHGHAIGDQVLIEVSSRINASLRSLDTASRLKDQTPARMGGDEFVVLLDGLKSFDDAQQVAQRVHDAVCHPAKVSGHEIMISASMGIALGSTEYAVPDDILRDADAALYHCKSAGKGRVGIFDDGIRHQMVERLRLSSDLRKAIKLGQLRLLYQPILSLESGRIESFEALLRWDHPKLGSVSPAQFIPIAEETGTIQDVGRWVLRESCQQLRVWHDQVPSHRDLAISVNVSPKQLSAGDFIENVRRTLAEIGLEGRHLIIEVTEGALVENFTAVNEILMGLRGMGVKIHLDDFGVGYSSLSYLHQLPFDAIKIDRSFVKDMKIDAVHANTIMAIQQMASNRKMHVIAEGIETFEQLVQLQALDCAMGQGYYLARPIDPHEAKAMLETGTVAMQDRTRAA